MPFLLLILGCIGLSISCIGLHIPLIHQFDTSTIVWIASHRNAYLNAITVVMSVLGGLPSTLIISGIGCLILSKSKKYTEIWFVLLSITGSAALGWLLKYAIDRPRPDEVYRMVETYGASFPSAHSIYATVLGCSVMFIFRRHKQAKLFIMLACFWLVCMGLSRIYLAAHYPTDVLAGWGIGLIWTTFVWFVLSHYALKRNKLF
ncbi:MAG: phosphatase PAP2 family protein [Acinetobacter sp.]